MDMTVNLLFQRTEVPGACQDTSMTLERILWINEQATACVAIRIAPSESTAWPQLLSREALEHDLALGLVRVVDADPFHWIYQPDTAFTAPQLAHRDVAWACIRPIIEEHTGELFTRAILGPLVRAAAEQCGKHKKQLYRYLRRYWQGGQVPNALLPALHRCGGRGRERPCSPSSPKRGRKSRLSLQTGEAIGVNIDEHLREVFRRSVRLFIYEQGMELTDAFRALSAAYFATDEIRDGVVTPVLLPASERPTLEQFRYWYEKERDVQRALIGQRGARRYSLENRAVLGSPRSVPLGPGSMYYYDATIGDVYLVSQLNRRRIIGRPVIHILIDLFSGLIAGVAVLLEGPSWVGAMLALENMTLNKVSFCKEYGITIAEADWPAHHVPLAITGDRGELFSKNAEAAIRTLHLRLVTTPPYRPDWKPVVERNFRTLNDLVIHWLPGAVAVSHERGTRDTRPDACLTPHEFRQILIHSVVTYNRSHALTTEHFDAAMLTDGVAPYPRDIWQWGIANRNGQLQTRDQDAMRRCLLPRRTASAQRDGLHFDGLRYSCASALLNDWFVRAHSNARTISVPILTDPRTRDHVYLLTDAGTPLEVCHVLDRDQRYQGCDWYDVDDFLALQRAARQEQKPMEQQEYIAHEAFRDHIVAEALRQTAQARPAGESKAERVGNIREHRRVERDLERQHTAWELIPSASPAPSSERRSLDAATQRRLALLGKQEGETEK